MLPKDIKREFYHCVGLNNLFLVLCHNFCNSQLIRYRDSTINFKENCHLNVKKLPKTWHFFKKIDKNCHFCQQNCQWQFCWKKWQFLSIFFLMSSFWQFFDTQLAIFRRVSCEERPEQARVWMSCKKCI